MPTLIKIAAASSSIYGHPYKWVRTLSSSSSSTSYSSSSSLFPFHSSFPLSSQTACNDLPHSSKSFQGGKLSHRPWRTTMTSCAPPAHVSTNHSPSISYNNSNNISSPTTKNSLLGFPGQKFSTSTANKRNSSNVKSKLSSSELGGEERDKISSSSSRTVLSSSSSDMGSENKDHEWFSRNNNSTIHNDCNGPVGQHRPHQLPSHDYQKHSKLLTLPTVLTLGRVAAVPLLVSTFYVDSWWGITATTSIFIAAAITDWLDGYLARKMKSSSAFGAFLDPVADKLMVAATLVLLCTQPLKAFGQVPWILTIPAIAIIGREITMSAVREWAASQSSKLLEAVAVNNLGKWKTATQMTALTILLATRDSSLAGPGILATLGVVLLYISAWLAVWSLFVYMRKIWKVLLK